MFDGWLDPKIARHSLEYGRQVSSSNPKVDGLFYWSVKGCPHYGRFTEIERPGRIQHTWMSPNTLVEDSTVTVTFKKQGENTLMTLEHSDLPDIEAGKRA